MSNARYVVIGTDLQMCGLQDPTSTSHTFNLKLGQDVCYKAPSVPVQIVRALPPEKDAPETEAAHTLECTHHGPARWRLPRTARCPAE